jgi:hypothetical protein
MEAEFMRDWEIHNRPRGRSSLLERILSYVFFGRFFRLPTAAFETQALGRKWVPPAILKDLEQAELAFAAGAHYGAGLLLRRACQYICLDKQIPYEKPRSQIQQLAANGTITTTLAQTAESIRVLGDELEHPDANTPSVITEDDVKAGWVFLTQLVRAIYVDPARGLQLDAGAGNKLSSSGGSCAGSVLN